MTLYTMFSVPIIHYKIDNWESNKNRILDILPPDCTDKLDPKDRVYTDYYRTSADLPNYSDTIIDIIKPYLNDFSEDRKIEIVDMWYQKYYKGATHSYHNHGYVGWSSVIYVEFDRNAHQSTKFISPFNNVWSGAMEFFQPPIEEGDMIIFPSNIMHEAPANISEVRRTIISYNLRGCIDTSNVTL